MVSIPHKKEHKELRKIKDMLSRGSSINKVNGYGLDSRSSITVSGRSFLFATTSNGF
jgi:hypothetical protein